MPIPTDTYWNIKRLNVWFAVSAVVLLLVTAWAIMQDFHQPWREPQRHGKVWEAALVDDKLKADATPEKQAEIAQLNAQIAEQEKLLATRRDEVEQIQAQIRQLESDLSTMSFNVNTLKANVGVDESQLQDAITAGDAAAERRLRAKLEGPRKQLGDDLEAQAAKKNQIAEARGKLKAVTSSVDELTKLKIKMTADADALGKKASSLQPRGLIANLSQQIREAPLLQFLNPATKVKQIVLSDILTEMPPMRVPTIDRCTTCHVNVENKEFVEPKVVAYLEEQVATSRKYNLPEKATGRPADPAATRGAPGAVAMPEFWHLYAATVAPEVAKRPASLNRIKTLAGAVGKQATLTIDGKKLASFDYASPALDQPTRDAVVAALLKAVVGYRPDAREASHGKVKVTLAENLDDNALAPLRVPAMKYVEDTRTAMTAALGEDKAALLNERYRRAMIAEANVARRKQGLKALDASRAMLAHPRLDLYVDVDSKHPLEAVGCTSCHDGSGQETNFVLAAHSPRRIWVDQKTGAPVLPEQVDTKSVRESHHREDLSSMLAAVYREDAIVPQGVSDVHLALDGHAKPQATTKPTSAPGAHSTTAPAAGAHESGHAGPAPAPTDYETALNTVPVTYVDPLTGLSGRAVPQMRQWIEHYEPAAPRSFKLVYHEWDWPMRPPQYLQANCVRCHSDVNDIKQEAPKVFEGKSLFVNMGCANCHQMDSIPADLPPENPSDARLVLANGQRKVGSDLRNITAKLSPSFINTWIWAPKAFRPSTKMPHFFMLENNSSDEELRRTRQEARAITEYLVRTANTFPQTGPGSAVAQADGNPSVAAGPLPPAHVVPPGAKGSPEAGKIVFNAIGCQGCHTNLNDDTGKKRASKPITLGEQWIVNDLVKSGDLAKQLTEQTGKLPDTKALTAAANELYDHMSYNDRHVYVTEHLAPDYSGVAPRYPDNTAKPLFQHHGPEISGVGTKLTAGRTPEQARAWLFDWLKNPQHYSEYTVMPQLRLSDQQALDLAEYLLAQKRPDDWKAELTPVDSPKLIEMTSLFLRSRFSARTALTKADEDAELLALASDALTTAQTPTAAAKAQAAAMSKDERRLVFLGKKLISHYGCMSCHAINGAELLSSPCANLSDWGKKSIDKLDFGYLDHHKLDTLKKDEKTGQPIAQAIHMVNGLSAKSSALAGAEWRADFPDGKVAKPVDAAWPHVDHSRVAWLTQKLGNTRAYDRGKALLEPDPTSDDVMLKSGKPYDKLKMPTFYLNEKEIDAIVTWVISNRGPKAEDRLITSRLLEGTTNEDAKTISRGRQLAQKFNCVGCHVIDGNNPSVHQFFEVSDVPIKAPPSLRGEGNKIQHAWLFNFLKHVEPLRPLLNPPPDKKPEIRMPSFAISNEEARAVAAYFSVESLREAKTLNKQLAALRAYKKAQEQLATTPAAPVVTPAAAAPTTSAAAATTKPAGAATASTDAIAPGEDWFTLANFAPQVAFLKKWALDNKQITELQLDPARNKPAELAKSWKTILFKAEFVAGLFDAPYPFVDDSRGRVDAAVYTDVKFKKGEALFYEMQCLKCHVLGDPDVEGAQKNPTAPNLSLTHRRLQRRWVRHWVQEPAIIQAGTAMPPFLTGLAVFKLDGLPWPRSQGSPEAECLRAEKAYGATADAQADLVLDFLYAAGIRGYTGIQPAGAAAPAAPATPPAAPAPAPKAGSNPSTPALAKPTDAAKPQVTPAPATPAPIKPADPKPLRPAPAAPAPEKNPEPKTSTPVPAKPADAAKPQAAAAPAAKGDASVSGKIVLTGAAPEAKEIDMSGVKECAAHHADPVAEQTLVVGAGGALKNVVVYVSDGLAAQTFTPPPEPTVIDQKGCMYEPHVLPVMVGQKIVVKNSDAFLHNVHALSTVNPAFNFGQPNVDPGKAIEPLKAGETFRVKCDVHPWMSAYIVGLEHPFFAASGDDGSFSIRNLPPGEYTLTAWHETLGTKEVPVKVEAGKPAEVKIEFAGP